MDVVGPLTGVERRFDCEVADELTRAMRALDRAHDLSTQFMLTYVKGDEEWEDHVGSFYRAFTKDLSDLLHARCEQAGFIVELVEGNLATVCVVQDDRVQPV